MGFKTFKNHFGIQNHIVSVVDGVLYIGSGYVSKLVGFNMQTGAVLFQEAFSDFLKKHYPEILNATDEERLALITVQDVFEQSIPVYTTNGGQIIEKVCEQLGFPNVTHDGELMYENTHFANKKHAIEYARKDLAYRIESYTESVQEIETKLAEKKQKLVETQVMLQEFNRLYPSELTTG